MKKIFEYTDYREWLRDAFEDFWVFCTSAIGDLVAQFARRRGLHRWFGHQAGCEQNHTVVFAGHLRFVFALRQVPTDLNRLEIDLRFFLGATE